MKSSHFLLSLRKNPQPVNKSYGRAVAVASRHFELRAIFIDDDIIFSLKFSDSTIWFFTLWWKNLDCNKGKSL